MYDSSRRHNIPVRQHNIIVLKEKAGSKAERTCACLRLWRASGGPTEMFPGSPLKTQSMDHLMGGVHLVSMMCSERCIRW